MLVEAADAVAAMPDDAVSHHREVTVESGTVLARTEAFLQAHSGLRELLCGESSKLRAALAALHGEPVLVFKEKINYKYPGGGAYAAHQDAPAYHQHDDHLTCMIPLDAHGCSAENGCLEFVAGRHREGFIALTDDGIIGADAEAAMDFVACPAELGDALVFTSHTPHRSGPNQSDAPRRVLYVTWNGASAGDLRDAYYEDKWRKMQSGNISMIKHWQGQPAE